MRVRLDRKLDRRVPVDVSVVARLGIRDILHNNRTRNKDMDRGMARVTLLRDTVNRSTGNSLCMDNLTRHSSINSNRAGVDLVDLVEVWGCRLLLALVVD